MKMKKMLAALTSLTCCAGAMAAFPQLAAPTYAAEVVYDSFEVNYDGWHGTDDSIVLTAEDNGGFGASRGMKVTGRTSTEDGAASSKGFYLTGGVKYDYSMQVFSEKDSTFKLTLLYIDAKTDKETVVELAEKKVKGGQWTELSADYKAPEGTYEYMLTLTNDSTDDFSFDEVKVTTKKSAADVYAIPSGKGLKDEFANYFRVGNILNGGTVNDSGIKANITKDCNVIECENETKPDATLVFNGSTDTNVKVSLSRCSAIADFAAKNGIGFRGHTFVWHSQTPVQFFKEGFNSNGAWVSKSTMDKRMESYIKNMFAAFESQYPSLELFAYDVCNECVSDDGNRQANYGGAREPGDNNVQGQGGKSGWVQVYGDNSFIEKAFTYARQYAPDGCKLYYNDYNEFAEGKQNCIINTILKPLSAKGVLDGMGMQSHISAAASNAWGDTNSYLKAMDKYLNLGIDVQVTELDISTEGGKFSLQDQATKYKAIFQHAMEWNENHPNGNKVTLMQIWGPNDANSWVGTDKATGKSNDPLLYDKNNQAKAAYNAIASLVPDSEWGDGKNPNIGSATATPVEPNQYGWYFQCGFEGTEDGFTTRGADSVKSSSDTAFVGSNSLYVSDREASWNGASYTLNTRAFKPGEEYSFSACVSYLTGDATDTFHLTLQYDGSDGEPHYDKIATATGVKGEWVQLANTNYKIPSDASNMQIYVETEDSLTSFYVDEVIGAVAGTGILGPDPVEIPSQGNDPVPSGKLIRGDINFDGKITALDMPLARKGIVDGISDSDTKKAADVDQSGTFEMNDVVLLNEYLVNKIKEFPVSAKAVDTSLMESLFKNVKIGSSYKKDGENNPIYTQRFGADPGWLVYDGRLYVYTTADEFAYKNNQMIENDYSSGYINVLSTADLVNWTDHGQIPVAKTRVNGTPIARWANNAWAPGAAWKKINGQDKFFLYFANNGSGIGVITADDPTFSKNVKDPLGHELISRSTPNSNVTWLFDPGVYYDPDTDTGIIAYGGGVPEGQAANTKQGRIAKLGSDMISIVGTPIDPGTPYLFEDSSMIKIGSTWYYSFCHNWNVPGGANVNGNSFGNADIGYMTSTDPLKGYQYQGVVFKNTGSQRLDNGGNNHHSIIEFKGNYYVLYHSRQLEMRMGVNGGKGLNYRSPCIDKATLNNGKITCSGSQNGVSQLESLNPYETVQAETMSNQSNDIKVNGLGNTTVSMKAGSWIKVSGVNFSKGADTITLRASGSGAIKVCVGSPTGDVLGYVELGSSMDDITVSTVGSVSGQKDLYFVASGNAELDSWSIG